MVGIESFPKGRKGANANKMTKTVEMVVSLKVPDTTAITALQTLHKLGFEEVKDIKRAEHYKFSVEGDAEKFRKQISKADLLVNANKHSSSFSIEKGKMTIILVKNINGNGSGILQTLAKLGIKAKKAEKSTMWSLSIEADGKSARNIAEKAARELLANEHYQEFSIL